MFLRGTAVRVVAVLRPVDGSVGNAWPEGRLTRPNGRATHNVEYSGVAHENAEAWQGECDYEEKFLWRVSYRRKGKERVQQGEPFPRNVAPYRFYL